MDFKKIGDIFSNSYYAVPDYQRDYEWTTSQISTMLIDIFDVLKDKKEENHFFGAIVTIPFEPDNATNLSLDLSDYNISENSIKHVVDGQQRLTSFSLFIRALYDLIDEDEELPKKFKDNFAGRQLDGYLIGNGFSSSNDSPAPWLLLNGDTGKCYNKDILNLSEENYKGIYKGPKRLKKAYQLFKTEILENLDENLENNKFKNKEEYYRELISVLTQKLDFVEIVCGKSSDAFQVFDSLNGKGLDLTAADRIKNIFMSWSEKKKGVQQWESLVKCVGEDYLTNFFVGLFFYTGNKRIPKNKLPEEFKNSYKSSANNNFQNFYNQIKNSAELYGKLRKAKTGVNHIDYILEDFKSLKLDQVYVLVFAVSQKFGEDSIKSSDYYEFLKTLFNLIVRMQICDRSMNKLDVLFSECIEEINHTAKIPVVTQLLKNEISLNVNDDEFKTAFTNYCPKSNKEAEVYLRHLENYRRKTEKKSRDEVQRGLTVEHIIPQTLEDIKDWYGDDVINIPEDIEANFEDVVVESIGNKALLYGDDNSSAGNNNYEIKIKIYEKGKEGQTQGTPKETFQLIKDLLFEFPDKFNHEEVKRRSEMLADFALEIWPSK